MKVCIVTLNGYHNYGNRLQNYALQTTLSNLGIDSNTLWHLDNKSIIKNKIKLLFPIKPEFKKAKNLYNFTKKYIDVIYTKNPYELVNNYDYFILGSDQVWNYEFKTFNNDMFLSFSPKEKNVAYAASFGFEKISAKHIEKYKNGLKNFKSISVREASGKDIVSRVANITDVDVVVDPTMLLGEEEWNEIVVKPQIELPEKYLLVYFLGKKSKEMQSYIKNVSEKNSWHIIDIMDKSKKYFSLGPAEFLYLEKNAQLVVTDSFHSTVFSIIFNTPFLVFDRDDKYKKMSSRLDNLLKMTKLEKQKIDTYNAINYENIDFSSAKEAIKKERVKALNFLITNLK